MKKVWAVVEENSQLLSVIHTPFLKGHKMIGCYQFQNASSIIYLTCMKPTNLFSNIVWHHLLPLDYLGLAVVGGFLILSVYYRIRQLNWQAICVAFPSLNKQIGKDTKGDLRYKYAKIRIRRRYLLFGEIVDVTIYGLDTVTSTTVEAARETISNFVGVELAPPPKVVGPVKLEVNHLVSKKKSIRSRLGL